MDRTNPSQPGGPSPADNSRSSAKKSSPLAGDITPLATSRMSGAAPQKPRDADHQYNLKKEQVLRGLLPWMGIHASTESERHTYTKLN